MFESSVISYGSQTQMCKWYSTHRLRVVLSHMVVKRVPSGKLSLCRLRVVLSHMVVKQPLDFLLFMCCLRVVLSHMVVKLVLQ